MLLVAVGFVLLVLGVLNVRVGDVEPLTFVYASIAACVLAGLFLAVGVVRSRPAQRPVIGPGAPGRQASWSGAAAWQEPDAAPARPDTPGSAPPPAAPGGAASDVEARLRAVPGVGPARLRALLDHFGSHEALASASAEEIAAVRGVSAALAQRIHDALRDEGP